MPRIICVVLLLAAAACTSRPAAPFPPAPSWTCRMHATHRRSSGRRPNRSGSRRSPTGSRRPASTTRPTTSLRLSTAAHIDAPVHFAQGRLTVDQIPLDRLIGQAVVVDVRDASASADYLVTVADIERAESQDGRIPDRAIVLIEPDSRVDGPMPRAIWGPPNAVRRPSRRCTFPLHPDAARWLIANRSISAIGIDTASIDYGQSKLFESHRLLFERDIPAFENLDSLERLPSRGATVIALPMKIAGGSGAPLRVIAVLPS